MHRIAYDVEWDVSKVYAIIRPNANDFERQIINGRKTDSLWVKQNSELRLVSNRHKTLGIWKWKPPIDRYAVYFTQIISFDYSTTTTKIFEDFWQLFRIQSVNWLQSMRIPFILVSVNSKTTDSLSLKIQL